MERSFDTPNRDAFEVHRAEVGGGQSLAFIREGVGGYPLLLLHGYPETKRIWWRNITPLAEAGFEVIVPDLRGYGDSGLAPNGFYDAAANSEDLYALVHDVLGHERCVAAGGDYGGVVMYDLALRHVGFIERQVFFNSVAPILTEMYEAAGVPTDLPGPTRAAADYYIRQGSDADGLCAELDTPEKRRTYIAGMYGHRFWASPGSFGPDDVDFMTEPFADADSLRAAMTIYEYSFGRELSAAPHMFEQISVPTVVLYGPDDHVIPSSFPLQCEVAFTDRVGPFTVTDAGHFLQWERPDVFNATTRWFCADLLTA